MSFRSVAMTCSRIAAFLMPLGLSIAGEYKGIRVGQDESSLPEALRGVVVYREGYHQGTWIRVSSTTGKVRHFDVIYSGRSFDRKVDLHLEVTLAQAIREHSLRDGRAASQFGYAVNQVGETYGLVDVPNGIVYRATPIADTTLVDRVSYIGDSAPVLQKAKERLLPDGRSNRLLIASRAADPVQPALAVAEEQVTRKGSRSFRASSREEAAKKLQEQLDVVLGKQKRTLALIRDLTTWFEVDPDHPEALSKAKLLREFFTSFRLESHTLSLISSENLDILELGDMRILQEATNGAAEVASKMRQLKAMGFE